MKHGKNEIKKKEVKKLRKKSRHWGLTRVKECNAGRRNLPRDKTMIAKASDTGCISKKEHRKSPENHPYFPHRKP